MSSSFNILSDLGSVHQTGQSNLADPGVGGTFRLDGKSGLVCLCTTAGIRYLPSDDFGMELKVFAMGADITLKNLAGTTITELVDGCGAICTSKGGGMWCAIADQVGGGAVVSEDFSDITADSLTLNSSDPYGPSWDADDSVPTKRATRAAIQAAVAGVLDLSELADAAVISGAASASYVMTTSHTSGETVIIAPWDVNGAALGTSRITMTAHNSPTLAIVLDTLNGTAPTAVGLAVLGAVDEAAARTAIGAGTGSGGYEPGGTDVAVTDGGTGASTAADARTNLGLGTIATQNSNNVTVTGGSITGITDLAVTDGGTGSSTASGARTNLGLAIGTNVQAYSSVLDTWTGINPSASVQTFLGSASTTLMRSNMGVGIGSDVQGYSSVLTTYASINPSANVQSFLAAANYAAMRTLMLVSATDTVAGQVELATSAEGVTATATDRAMTPASSAAQFDARIGSSGVADTAVLRGLKTYRRDSLTFPFTEGDMDDNVAVLREYAGEGDHAGWADNYDKLKLPGDIIPINDTIHFAARTGFPCIECAGGEPTYHPMTQYDTVNPAFTEVDGDFNASSGVFTANDADVTTSNVLQSAWVYGKRDDAADWQWCAPVIAVNAGANTFTVAATPFWGTYATLTRDGTASGDGCTVQVWSAKGGLPTMVVWGDGNYTKEMYAFYGYGGHIEGGLALYGKQSNNGTSLITDGAPAWVTSTAYVVGDCVTRNATTYSCTTSGTSSGGPSGTGTGITDGTCVWASYSYPYDDPLPVLPGVSHTSVHPNEDRARVGLAIHSTEGLGSGKHIFTGTFAPTLCQIGLYVSDNTNVTPDHGDQCLIPRFAPTFCDIGAYFNQRQAFSWRFPHSELVSTRWGFLIDAGGKALWDKIDMGADCDIAVYIRGDESATGTGPDEYDIRSANIDELSPDESIILKVDTRRTGTLTTRTSDSEGIFTVRLGHNFQVGSTVYVYWTGGVRSAMYVSAITATTVTIGENPAVGTQASGSVLPSTSTAVEIGGYSSTTTFIRNAHVPDARASEWRGDAVYSGSGTLATSTFTASSNLDLSTLANDDWLWVYTSDTASLPSFVVRVSSFNDGANTITLGSAHYGSLSNGTYYVRAYRPSSERPLFEYINSYGMHDHANIRAAHPRMFRVKAGVAGYFPTIYLTHSRFYHNSFLLHATMEKIVADLFTTDSDGYVSLEFRGNHENAGGTANGGKMYPDIRAYGSLSNGVFTATDIDYWPT